MSYSLYIRALYSNTMSSLYNDIDLFGPDPSDSDIPDDLSSINFDSNQLDMDLKVAFGSDEVAFGIPFMEPVPSPAQQPLHHLTLPPLSPKLSGRQQEDINVVDWGAIMSVIESGADLQPSSQVREVGVPAPPFLADGGIFPPTQMLDIAALVPPYVPEQPNYQSLQQPVQLYGQPSIKTRCRRPNSLRHLDGTCTPSWAGRTCCHR